LAQHPHHSTLRPRGLCSVNRYGELAIITGCFTAIKRLTVCIPGELETFSLLVAFAFALHFDFHLAVLHCPSNELAECDGSRAVVVHAVEDLSA